MSGVELTQPMCAGLNTKIGAALEASDNGALKDILETLAVSDATGKLQNLAQSKLAKTVKKLETHQDATIAATASRLVKYWKTVVADNKKSKDSAAPPAAAASPEVKAEAKAEVKADAAEVKAAASSAAVASILAPAPAPAPERKASSGKWVPTGDSVRDSVIAKLKDLFDKGLQGNEVYVRGLDIDSAALAQECEAGMDSRFGGPTKEYKARYRSLVFNLQDPKNPEFMRSVLMGQVPIDMLSTMEVKDMASAAMQEARRKAVEQSKMSLMDKKSWEKYVGKEQQEGILKCPRCKSMLTEYTEVQTRSADEPTTKKCLCNACGYRWKFC